ncbi:MAG: SDR family oxidoreductase [Desulfobulbaceae bacterium]|nr:SDR family oxidoreductase [Desulfobulbaceae bacterium]
MDFRPESFFGLHKKTALITGAAGQLGSGIIDGLLACGANIVATDMSVDDLDATAERCGWPHERVVPKACDIRERKQVAAAINIGLEHFGPIDFLINNAGVSVFEPYLERPENSIDFVMDVNLKGTILCSQEFVKHRIKHGADGAIVNIASHYGLISPDPRIYTDCDRKNSEIYGASKAGIIQLTKYYAAHAIEHGIRTNAVSPGGVRNPNNPQGPDFQKNYGFRCPMGRMAETHEVVGAVLYLLSPAASYVNGHNIVVDGGMSAW